MDWRDELEQASFRAVPFKYRSAAQPLGRRIVRHEFPLRDDPVLEDLGSRSPEFTLEAFVLGDDYMDQRDALMKALNAPGPGELIHPYRGRLTVAVSRASVRESTAEGGMATFTITFLSEGLAPLRLVVADTENQVKAAAAETAAAAGEDFEDNYSLLRKAQFVVQGAEEAMTAAMQEVEAVVEGVTSTIAAVIRFPANVVAGIQGGIARIRALVNQPLQALTLLRGLFDAGSGTPAVAATTSSRKRQAANQQALNLAVQRNAIAEAAAAAADALSTGAFGSDKDALEARDGILAAIDDQLGLGGDRVFSALTGLRAAVVGDFAARSSGLPPVTRFTPAITMPALVIAQQLYGDGRREGELIERNNIRHPLFVVGGDPLEVRANA